MKPVGEETFAVNFVGSQNISYGLSNWIFSMYLMALKFIAVAGHQLAQGLRKITVLTCNYPLISTADGGVRKIMRKCNAMSTAAL